MNPEPLTRRTLFASVLAFLFLRKTAAAVGHEDCVQEILSGLRRNAVTHRSYRVHATATALGIPFFHRENVGGGYASVETGLGAGMRGTALQFVAGSWPDRSAGLNRFGAFREAIVERGSGQQRAFAGFITSSKEESLHEARGALKQVESGTPLVAAWGVHVDGSGWFHVKGSEAPVRCDWQQAVAILSGLTSPALSTPPQVVTAAAAPTFLTAIRHAALSNQPSLRSPFLHNGKPFELHTHWRSADQLEGQIVNQNGTTTARFRNYYAQGDASGLPIRIEYNARSFLRLTFEADPTAATTIPSLFPESPA